jgi:diamine N-acetyltransferase
MNICLGLMNHGDQEFLRRLRSDPHVAHWLFSPVKQITEEEQEAWYQRVMKDDSCLVWVVRSDPDMERVGYGQLYRIDMLHMTCECGVVVAPQYQGNGIGSEITLRLLEYAFEMLALNSVTALVFCDNTAALMMFGKCGFVVRGWLPEARFKRGEYRDIFVMSITRGDYDRHNSAGSG